MSSALDRVYLQFEVGETSEGRGYWLDRPWVNEDQRPALLNARILALPHFQNEEQGPYFPSGSEAIIARLKELVGDKTPIAVAIRSKDYQEVALHSKAWRLPTLFVSVVAWPIVANILANRIDELLPGHKESDTAELTLIIEDANHKSLKFQFKGNPRDLGNLLDQSVAHFVDKLDDTTSVNQSKQGKRGE